MHRSVVLFVTIGALVAASALVWVEVRQEREFRRLIAVGDAALADGQSFVAIESFSGALVLKPTSMLAYLKRGDAYRQRGELSAAFRDLRAANALDPSAPQPIERLGDVNGAMGRHERAAEHYTRYLELDDRAARVLYKLAVARYRSGQTGRSVEALRRALALDDRLAEAHLLLGVVLRAQGQRDEALQSLRRAAGLNPALAAAREELADALLSAGRYREGIEQLEALAALEPNRVERQVSVGLWHARLGLTDAAILTLGRAAERHPDAPIVYEALGRVWLGLADGGSDAVSTGKAVEALGRAASRTDASSTVLTLYGRALLLVDDVRRAERVLQQAVTRLPVEASAYQHLHDAASRLGHTALARDAAARYAALTAAE